jgi:dihydrofolate synthase/folylpolyglutamate synthase
VLRLRGRDFDAETRASGTWDFRGVHRRLEALPAPALAGLAQAGNAATAISALDELAESLPMPRAAVEAGLRTVTLAGRFQVVPDARGFDWILDVAHNAAAARLLAQNLSAPRGNARTIAIGAMLVDKDAGSVLSELRNVVDRWFAATTSGPRGMSAALLAEKGRIAGIEMEQGGMIPDAMRMAARAARPGDRVVVFGSFLTVGPALEWLVAEGLLARDSW